jgi:CubicO group peptidase (beta-lactamase class C family)
MTDGGRGLLSALEMVNPHRAPGRAAWCYLPVPAADPRPHPAADPLDVGAEAAALHRETAGTALLVLADGAVVHAWYGDGLGPRDLLLGASATKSVLAHLVGAAVRAGALELDRPVQAYVPELRDSGYRGVPVRALLTMTSGVAWLEDHRDPAGPATALVGAFAAGGSSRALLASVGRGCAPGLRHAYNTADSQVLDWVRERATGLPFVPALAALWRDLGCVEDGVVAVDGDGVALAGGGLAAAAGDWARIGLLQVDGTAPGGTRLLDCGWVDAASRPSLPFLRPGRLPDPLSAHVGFGFHWWPLDDAGSVVAADGSRGQFVVVDRARRTVVVKTSAWPHADAVRDRHLRDLCYLALPAIAASASAAVRERAALRERVQK